MCIVRLGGCAAAYSKAGEEHALHCGVERLTEPFRCGVSPSGVKHAIEEDWYSG